MESRKTGPIDVKPFKLKWCQNKLLSCSDLDVRQIRFWAAVTGLGGRALARKNAMFVRLGRILVSSADRREIDASPLPPRASSILSV